MAIAEATRELTKNIRRSHIERAATLAGVNDEAMVLRRETQDMLEDFHASQSKSAAQQRKELAQNQKDRERGSKERLMEFDHWREEIGARLGSDWSKARAERNASVNEILTGTRNMLTEFNDSCQETGAQMRSDWSRTRAERDADVNELLTGVRNMLTECQTAHRNMGIQLRSDLTRSREIVNTDVAKMRAGSRQAQAEVKADLREAAEAWMSLGAIKPAARTSQEEASNLRTRLLATIDQHKEGISLPEVAKSIGVMTVVLGEPVKELLGNSKIRKEGKLYFPVAPIGV